MAKKTKVKDEEDLDDDDEDSDDDGADKDNVDDDEEMDDDEVDDDEDEENDDDDDEPRVRKNLSHIIARKNRTIKKLRSKKDKDDDDADDDEDDDGDIKERVGQEAKKILGPMANALDQRQVDIDISTFLADPRNAKFRKYEKKARRWAAHPSRAQVPIPAIFKEIAFDDFAAEADDDADQKKDRARRANARGNSFRNPPASDTEKIRKLNFRDKDFGTLRQRIGAGETINLAEEE